MPADIRMDGDSQTGALEAATFAAPPVWARDTRKRRGRRTPARDAVAPTNADVIYEPLRAPPRRHRRGRGAILAAGAATVVAAAGLGWYASRPHDNGMPVLVPGDPGNGRAAPNAAEPPGAAAPLAVVARAATEPGPPATPAAHAPAAQRHGGARQAADEPDDVDGVGADDTAPMAAAPGLTPSPGAAPAPTPPTAPADTQP